jgi:hypothetical protein
LGPPSVAPSFALTPVETPVPKAKRKAAPKAPKEPTPEPPKPPGFPEVIAAFHETFLAKRGVKPGITPREGKAARELLQAFGAESAVGIIRRAFEDPWLLENNPTLACIVANANRYLGEADAPGEQMPAHMHVPKPWVYPFEITDELRASAPKNRAELMAALKRGYSPEAEVIRTRRAADELQQIVDNAQAAIAARRESRS